MTPEEVSRVLAILKSNWPDAKITEDVRRNYAAGLSHLSYQEAERAALDCVRNQKWFPKVAELCDAAAEHSIPVDPEVGWEEVMREVKRVGYKPLPVFRNGVMEDPPQRQFSSPLIERAVNAVGWDAICFAQTDKIGVQQAAFTKAYNALVEREKRNVRSYGTDRSLWPGQHLTIELEGGGHRTLRSVGDVINDLGYSRERGDGPLHGADPADGRAGDHSADRPVRGSLADRDRAGRGAGGAGVDSLEAGGHGGPRRLGRGNP